MTAVRRTRQVLTLVIPAIALVRICKDTRSTELWVGDSHAVFLNNCWPVSSRLSRIDDQRFVWHLGPRLMYSIANNGFPLDVLLVARLIHWFGGSRNVALIFVFGEIDVRVHLADTQAQSRRSLKFLSEYAEQCRLLGQKLGATHVVVTVPVPPGDSFDDAPEFPRSGTLAERINAFRELRQALEAALSATGAEPKTVLLDCTEKLANPDGSLRADLTDDGCHVNKSGALLVRGGVQAILL